MKNSIQYFYEKVREIMHNDETVSAIAYAIARGDRVEIVPAKDGAKLLVVHKHEYKPPRNGEQNNDAPANG